MQMITGMYSTHQMKADNLKSPLQLANYYCHDIYVPHLWLPWNLFAGITFDHSAHCLAQPRVTYGKGSSMLGEDL